MSTRATVAVVLMALLAACSAETATPGPTRRPTRTPAPLVVEPSPTPIPPAPSATPDLSAELCPLTGVRDPGKRWLSHRPLLFKIDNGPAARPQSGLASADIVIEHLTEGGVTRFDAVFWCSSAETVGPIRSARIVDLDLVSLFQAVLVHVGASNENLAALREAFGNRLMDEGTDKAAFHRVTDRSAPYNTYAGTEGVWSLLPGRGISQSGVSLKGLTFRSEAPGGAPAARLLVPYDKQFSDSAWEYVPERQQYRRLLMGAALDDAQSGQVHVPNVVVLFAPHRVTDIVEDSLGSLSIKIELKGRGRAVVFRDGQALEGQWVREGEFLRLTDAANKDIALKPGRAWWHIVPPELKLEWQ